MALYIVNAAPDFNRTVSSGGEDGTAVAVSTRRSPNRVRAVLWRTCSHPRLVGQIRPSFHDVHDFVRGEHAAAFSHELDRF